MPLPRCRKKGGTELNYADYLRWLTDQYRREQSTKPIPWKVSGRLGAKITPEGEMNDFPGATTVFKLREQDRLRCEAIAEKLHRLNPGMLVRIEPATLHLTLHALSNGYSVAFDKEAIEADILKHEPLVAQEFRLAAQRYGDDPVRLTCLGPSTNGNDVVSLKFVPSRNSDYEVLNGLFARFEALYPLHRPYVPHISLGYFKLHGYGTEEVDRLYASLSLLERESRFEIELNISRLVYQRHNHMNDFRDVFAVRDFMANIALPDFLDK